MWQRCYLVLGVYFHAGMEKVPEGLSFIVLKWFLSQPCVLGSARTGLIFTRIQEGAQPGGLTQPQPGQTEPGIPHHVPSCWVPVRGVARWELSRGSGGHSGGAVRESGSVLRALFCGFVLCNPLFYIVVVPVSLCLLFC